MGKCQYCGQSAGFFSSKHDECALKHDEGVEKIREAIRQASEANSFEDLSKGISQIAQQGLITGQEIEEISVHSWEKAATRFLEDSLLDEKEEKSLMDLQESLDLSQAQLDKKGIYGKVAKSAILRELMAGKIPDKLKINGTLPFNFQKDETLVWLFTNVPYLEEKTHTVYVGSSQGVSMRIMKGLYYRVGAFKGQPVSKTAHEQVDTGFLALTNKHIYFAGQSKSFRIQYDKIVSFKPYEDGIGIVRDATSAKPQTFITNDGWFTYNLVTNLAKME